MAIVSVTSLRTVSMPTIAAVAARLEVSIVELLALPRDVLAEIVYDVAMEGFK